MAPTRVSGPQIKDGGVDTADLAARAVTYPKIQAVSATDKVLGRASAGSGDVEEIACTAAGRALIDDATAAVQRATLGGTTVGQNFFTATNPSAITFPRVNADNTVSLLSDSAFLSAIGGVGGGNQNANYVYAGPTSGGAAAPTFRPLNNADIPTNTIHPTGAYSGLGASQAGLLHFPNDGFNIFRDTGSVLAPWGPIFPFTTFVNTGFSWLNQGTSTFAATRNGFLMTIPASAGSSIRAYTKSKSAPYTITMGFIPMLLAAASTTSYGGRAGLCWSNGTAFVSFTIENGNSLGGPVLVVNAWTNSTTFNASYVSYNFLHIGPIIWLRIADDNTNRICSLSVDGQNWRVIHTVARTNFLTPTTAGLFLEDGTSNIGQQMTILHWAET